MTEITLTVEGMSCGMCSAKVENALKAVNGVTSVNVDLKRGIAKVSYDGATKDEDLTMAVIDAGFKAKVKRGLFK